eukprot:6466452-Amphidinium_carterae.1
MSIVGTIPSKYCVEVCSEVDFYGNSSESFWGLFGGCANGMKCVVLSDLCVVSKIYTDFSQASGRSLSGPTRSKFPK